MIGDVKRALGQDPLDRTITDDLLKEIAGRVNPEEQPIKRNSVDSFSSAIREFGVVKTAAFVIVVSFSMTTGILAAKVSPLVLLQAIKGCEHSQEKSQSVMYSAQTVTQSKLTKTKTGNTGESGNK